MSERETSLLVAARALNFVRREHPATYCALRMLLDSMHGALLGPWLHEYVRRRSTTNRYQTQQRYSVYKGETASGFEYRRCLIPSPTSVLTEVWALAILARSEHFRASKSVYSYLWASDDSPHIFEHFFDGYLRREYDVTRACENIGPAGAVVISDIKNFYGSVPMDRLRTMASGQVGMAGFAHEERTLIEFAVDTYFTPWNIKHGIPIGPPLGHVLAQFYLSDLDRELTEAFPGRYFRYVDDIIIVSPPHAVDAARATVHEAIRRTGLFPNPDKDEIVSRERWLAHAVAISMQPKQDPFAQVRKEVRVWTDRVHDTSNL